MAALGPVAHLSPLPALAASAPGNQAFTVHVGSYAPQGEGIYNFRADVKTGLLQPLGLTTNPHSPTWLQADPARPGLLYAANEGGHSVHVYRQQADGRLQLLQALPSGGQGPVHLSLHSNAPFAFVAHYGSAELAVLARAADGQLSPVGLHSSCSKSLMAHFQPRPRRAVSAPPGSWAISGHEAPHMHMALSTPDGLFVLASDLGRDRLAVWPFDPRNGSLGLRQDLALSAGAGPRHFVFHPRDPAQLYLLNEEASTLVFLRMDAQTGSLEARGELSSLPEGFVGTNFASDLWASPDGKFLYALNRLHDSIAIFALAADGTPKLLAHEWTRGSYPRSARTSPCGRWLYVCNQRSDHVAIFAFDAKSGLPRFSGAYTAVPSPTSAEMLG